MDWSFHTPKAEVYNGVEQWTIKIDVPAGWKPTGQAPDLTGTIITLYYKADDEARADTDTWYTGWKVNGSPKDHELYAQTTPEDPSTETQRRRKPVTMATSGGGGDENFVVKANFDKRRLEYVKYKNLPGPRMPILGPLFHSMKRWLRRG